MMSNALIFAEGLSATADATGLAREQFWGVMIAVFCFVAFAIGAIIWFLRDQQNSITQLFAKSIDANAKLSEAIDKLGDETRDSNSKLREYLDSNLDKIAEAIRDIGDEIEDHHKRLTALELEHAAEHTGDRQ